VVEANVSSFGFAQVVSVWIAFSHLTRLVNVVLQVEGQPEYFVGEINDLHMFCLSPSAKMQSAFPEMTYVRTSGSLDI
jgi:hypothetical protein